jgi:hypothetical protein
MLRLIERIDAEGLRVESGFVDDAYRPKAPTSSPDAPEEATLTPMEHVVAIASLAGKIAVVVISTWLVLAIAAAIVWLPQGGSDPCVGIDTMRLQHCSAAGQ